MSEVHPVRVSLNEPRCGQFEFKEAGDGDFEVPRPLWEAVLAADAGLAEAQRRQREATLAVVRHVADRHPEDDVFTEWARLGMEAF